MGVPRNADGRDVVTHRGCALGYTLAGEGERVLFIQGTGLHGDGWLPQLEELTREYACLWFDNRGVGRSQPVGDARVSVPQMAEDARVLLDHVGWSDAHVVGHSLGGCIALELALSARERVRSLALLCTAADGAALTRLDTGMLWRGLRMQVGTRRARRAAFLEVVLTREEHSAGDLDAIAEQLKPVFGHDLAAQPRIVFRQVAATKRWNVTARLGELAGLPTLVAGAEHDLIARAPLVEALADGIPGAVRVEWKGAAHGVPVTASARVNGTLREHLERVSGRKD